MTRFLRLSLVALVLLLAGALASCSDAADNAAVTVNGTVVPQSEIDAELDDLVGYAEANPDTQFAQAVYGEGEDTVNTAFTAQVLQERVVAAVVAEEFDRRNLEITDADRQAAEEQFAAQLAPQPAADPNADPAAPPTTADPAAGQAVFDQFSQSFQDFEVTFNAQAAVLSEALAAEAGEDAAVTGADVRAYYDDNQDQFTQNCASHILVDDEATAQDLSQQLADGADFATLAAANSTDTGSAANGGDLGCQPVGSFVPEFEAAIAAADVGTVTEPVQTQFGYHLILVNQKGVAPFADVKAQIRSQLEAPAQDPLNTFLSEALGSAEVEVNSRYGRWDADTMTVVPPEGPSTPSTTLPDLGTAPAQDPSTTDSTTAGG